MVSMKLAIHTAIIGAGFAGAITQYLLNKKGHYQNIIVERGYVHGKSSDNYVVYTKGEYGFSGSKIQTKSSKISSGAKPFKQEYTEKLYHRSDSSIALYAEDNSENIEFEGNEINVQKLFSESRIYGNIEITSIDLHKKKLHGRVLHLNKPVEISYNTLINTIPIYEFTKLAGINLLKEFDIFISYFPIGIKITRAMEPSDIMQSDYYSDPNIPFYRKHQYKNSISYEYCLNKPFEERFSAVIIPGKFIKIPDSKLEGIYEFFERHSAYMIGRYSLWNPDFMLDHIIDCTIEDKCLSNHVSNLFKRFK